MAFQIQQSLDAGCNDAMHESVNSTHGCQGGFSRDWFEWSNALFVVLVETALGERCDAKGRSDALISMVRTVLGGPATFHELYMNPYNNTHFIENLLQGIEAQVQQ
jgi:hypothetical protein